MCISHLPRPIFEYGVSKVLMFARMLADVYRLFSQVIHRIIRDERGNCRILNT